MADQNQGASIEAERAEFEAWTRKDIGMPDHVPFNWESDWVKAALEGWMERARRSVPPAAGELPPLPEPTMVTGSGNLYGEVKVIQYRDQCIAADRAQRKQAGQVGVKPWQERLNAEGLFVEGERLYGGWTAVTMARDAEIADLRAQLARQDQGNSSNSSSSSSVVGQEGEQPTKKEKN